MAEVISSQKGKPLLIYKGFGYHFHSENVTTERRYWRCSERSVCNATVITTHEGDNIIVIKDGSDFHLHELNKPELKAKIIREDIKRLAQENPCDPPTRLIRQATENVTDDEVLAVLPERIHLKRAVNRQQNKNRPVIPKSLRDIQVAEPYSLTKKGERFLMHDSGAEDQNRILIFTTADDVRHMANSATLFVDGTFKTVPQQFLQMVTIHGLVRNCVFPFVYCLTENKTEETYQHVYHHLKLFSRENEIELHPTSFMMDFELANMNAARTEFPDARVNGCLFHFTQSLWRNVVNNGLQGAYNDGRDNNTVRRSIQELMALPFVPVEEVIEVFDDLYNELEEELLDFATYIEVTYIRGRRARGRRRATPARYPPAVWNVYDLVINKQQRTNNVVEGFHSKFQKLIAVHHANIWRFIDQIKSEQHDTESLITQVLAGHTKIKQPVNQKYKRNQSQIEDIVRNYRQYEESNEIRRYLRSISYHLKIGP